MIKSGEHHLCVIPPPPNPNGIEEKSFSSSSVSLGSLLQPVGFPKWKKMIRWTEGSKGWGIEQVG